MGGAGFVYNREMERTSLVQLAAATQGWKREAIIAVMWLAAGALLLPVLIYLCGITFLGSYEGGGLGRTFGTVLRGLAAGSPASWVVVAGPYVLFQLLRVLIYAWNFGAARD